MQQTDELQGSAVDEMFTSQFPLWDFFECNKGDRPMDVMASINSQFPLWDFFECNVPGEQVGKWSSENSQFPLWDFFECNSFIV